MNYWLQICPDDKITVCLLFNCLPRNNHKIKKNNLFLYHSETVRMIEVMLPLRYHRSVVATKTNNSFFVCI